MNSLLNLEIKNKNILLKYLTWSKESFDDEKLNSKVKLW